MAFPEICSYFGIRDCLEDEEEYAKCENMLGYFSRLKGSCCEVTFLGY